MNRAYKDRSAAKDALQRAISLARVQDAIAWERRPSAALAEMQTTCGGVISPRRYSGNLLNESQCPNVGVAWPRSRTAASVGSRRSAHAAEMAAKLSN